MKDQTLPEKTGNEKNGSKLKKSGPEWTKLKIDNCKRYILLKILYWDPNYSSEYFKAIKRLGLNLTRSKRTIWSKMDKI